MFASSSQIGPLASNKNGDDFEEAEGTFVACNEISRLSVTNSVENCTLFGYPRLEFRRFEYTVIRRN